jgi:hypothetical protein
MLIVPRAGGPFGLAQALRPIPAGTNAVTNYRGLPAVSYHERSDFNLQQEVSPKPGSLVVALSWSKVVPQRRTSSALLR